MIGIFMFFKKIFNSKGKKPKTQKISAKKDTITLKEKMQPSLKQSHPRKKVEPHLKKVEPRNKVTKISQTRLLTAEGWKRRKSLH